MTKHNWSEFGCDYCGDADYYPCGYRGQTSADELAKRAGWIIVNNKHFCSKECYENYKKVGNNESR